MNEQTGLSVQCKIILPNGYMCGIPAIRRCRVCLRAYCASHQALLHDFESSQDFDTTNLCVMCLQEMRDEQDKAIEAEYAPTAFFEDGEARKLMQKSGKSKVKVYHAVSVSKKGLFGVKYRTEYEVFCYGWVIGTLYWNDLVPGEDRFDSPNYGRETLSNSGEHLTVLLDANLSHTRREYTWSYHYGLIPVKPYADGYICVQISGSSRGWLINDIEQAGQLVRELAGATK